MRYGYARVSTQEQETHAQIDALTGAGVDLIYEEKRSGGDRKRPVLEKMISSLKPGDVVIVYKMDRIARSLAHLLQILERIQNTGAEFKSLTEIIDTTSPAGKMIAQILGAFAEFELALIRERTRVGMKAAVARGSILGRPKAITNEAEIKKLRAKGMTLSAIARLKGCHIASVKRAIKRQQAREELEQVEFQNQLDAPSRQQKTKSDLYEDRHQHGARSGDFYRQTQRLQQQTNHACK